MPSSVPEPVAEGSLNTTPFGHVLLSIQKKGLSGTLAIWPEDGRSGQDRILFRSGAPTVGRFLDPAIDLEQSILSIFERPKGAYAFYETDLVGEAGTVLRGYVDVFRLLATALRTSAPEGAMARVIRKLGSDRQRIKKGAPLAKLQLQSNERAVVELIRAEPAAPAAILQQFGEPKVAQRMLYLLAITGCLEAYRPVSRQKLKAVSRKASPRPSSPDPPGRTSNPGFGVRQPGGRLSTPGDPPGAHVPHAGPALPQQVDSAPTGTNISGEVVAPRDLPPAPPENMGPEDQKRWEEIVRVFSMMDRQNYFEMLGIKESADGNEARQKYLALAKIWHPDRLPPQLVQLRPYVEEIFHLLTTARDTLTDSKKRGEYQKTVMQGGGTPEADRKLNIMVETAINFQKVDVLVKRRRYDEALEICDAAIAAVRKEPDYPAMKAWILLLRDGVDDPDSAEQIRNLLRKTFQLNPDHVQGHFVRANFLKRQGEHDKALKHFRKVANLDPKNLAALREVRIGTMRQSRGRSSAPPPRGDGKPSIFGKFFKK